MSRNLEKEEHIFQSIPLKLGDIIQIQNPANDILHNNSFLIDYIDETKTKLIDINNKNITTLTFDEKGALNDTSIHSISILYRSEEDGYAKQNGLLPGKWINIYFQGDVPFIITGEITNLEEDMIEVKSFPDNSILYINFEYKGLPENIPIEKIEFRKKPESVTPEEGEEGEKEEEGEEETIDITKSKESISPFELEDVSFDAPIIAPPKQNIREFILQAKDIVFGEELAPIIQMVEVSESQKRYNIESQTNDLLDDLLSTIPIRERTRSVLDNIHIIIERFKQLRNEFSIFDENHNVIGAFKIDDYWKPLANQLDKLDTPLYWILPVATNIKKIYDIQGEESDISEINLNENLTEMKSFIQKYHTNDPNKYTSLFNNLNPFFTPYENPLYDPESTYKNYLIEKQTGANWNTIINNMDEFNSSAVSTNHINTKKFLVQTYNTGLSKLNIKEITGSRLVTTRGNLTEPDQIAIQSFLTLPEQVIDFSHIQLPATNILKKSNLNQSFFYYYLLLTNNTNINNVILDEKDFSQDKEKGEDKDKERKNVENMWKKINHFAFLRQENTQYTDAELYKKYVDSMIPTTKELFQSIRKHISLESSPSLSILSIVEFLEPFLVYTNDITYDEYKDIHSHLKNKLIEYNKNFSLKKTKFNSLSNSLTSLFKLPNSNLLLHLFNDKSIFDYYPRTIDQDTHSTNSELLRSVIMADYGDLFQTAIALQNLTLMLPENISQIMDEEISQLNTQISEEERNNKCIQYVIVKQYKNTEEVDADNNITIYVDPKYDSTQYSIMDDFEKEELQMAPETFTDFLIQKLQSKFKYPVTEAIDMAQTLIHRAKKVVDGNYAIVYDQDKNEYLFYKRENNAWIADKNVSPDLIKGANDQNLMCNLQDNCIDVEKKYQDICSSYGLNVSELSKDAIKEIVDEFDKNYYLGKEKLTKIIQTKYDYYMSIMDKLENINMRETLKYNNMQYQLGLSYQSASSNDSVISPYAPLRDIILGQADFVKKQYDIIQFANKFTREADVDHFSLHDNAKESPYWRYCIETNVKLLPNFIFVLASTYIDPDQPDSYFKMMEIIIKEVGAISDDGDSWVDKYSGYVIRKIDLDVDEGYEESGYKRISRAFIEEEAGSLFLTEEKKKEAKVEAKVEAKAKAEAEAEKKKKRTPEMQLVSNIVYTILQHMGLQIDDEYIIQMVANQLTRELNQLPSEVDYNKIRKPGQKEYTSIKNEIILYNTLAVIMIAIQTAVPSIKTRRTFPGCVRSFTGFPLEGEGDDSSILYMACIAYHTRSSIVPWNVLQKIKMDSIVNRLKMTIQNILTNNDGAIKQKIEEKRMYLLTNATENIPNEHDLLVSWSNFLPPLQPFTPNNKIAAKNLENISADFKYSLQKNIKQGSANQREQILVIQSKIIFFSLAIQQKIQLIVSKEDLLLKTNSNKYFMENACCNTKSSITIDYFKGKEKDIELFNGIVEKLANTLYDIHSITEASYLFCRENSKNVYPSLNYQFNEETIYKAFMLYCKFNSLQPIHEKLLPLCVSKPDSFLKTDSISEKIRKLKQEGRNYTNEGVLKLLQIVSRENIVPVLGVGNVDGEGGIHGEGAIYENAIYENTLNRLRKEEMDTNSILSKELMDKLLDIGFKMRSNDEWKKKERALNNYLGEKKEEMKKTCMEFFSQSELSRGEKRDIQAMIESITTISGIQIEESDSSSSENAILLIKDFIKNMISVFSNIIVNKVDYDVIASQKHLNLSFKHETDIQKIISNYYSILKPFYEKTDLNYVLIQITIQCNIVERMIEIMDLFAFQNKSYTKKLLLSHMFLLVLNKYISLSMDPRMLQRENYEMETPTQEIVALKTQVRKLLMVYFSIYAKQKKIVNVDYDKIMNEFFKIKEREKNKITDDLQKLTQEQRDVDTLFKSNKLGRWGTGLQKGFREYDAATYDKERDLLDLDIDAGIDADNEEMEREGNDKYEGIRNRLRRSNQNIMDANEEQYIEDYLEEEERDEQQEEEDNQLEYEGDDNDDNDEYEGDDNDFHDGDYQQYTEYGD